MHTHSEQSVHQETARKEEDDNLLTIRMTENSQVGHRTEE